MKSLEKTEQTIFKFEKIAPEVYKSLHALKRTGWVDRGVVNPESVKEHTESLIRLSYELSEFLTEEEKDGLSDMLEIHDWPEAIHGDEVILELDPGERQVLKDNKFENEKVALESICAGLEKGNAIIDLWLRFENSEDPAAVFARELDKYQAVEKALEFEESQGVELFNEFLSYSINFITHPILLKRIEVLKDRQNK